MKTILAILMLVAVAGVGQEKREFSAAEWQSIVTGTAVEIESPMKFNTPVFIDSDRPMEIVLGIHNRNAFPLDCSAEVFFLTGSQEKVMTVERQIGGQKVMLTVRAAQFGRLNVRPVSSHKTKVIRNWRGYIVRLSVGCRLLKIAASSPDLERLAQDPEKMAALSAGKSVPVK